MQPPFEALFPRLQENPFLVWINFKKVIQSIEFIPIFLIWAVWSGLGVAFLLHTFATFRYKKWRPVVVALLLGIFLFMLMQTILSTLEFILSSIFLVI